MRSKCRYGTMIEMGLKLNKIKEYILRSGYKNTYIAEQLGVHDTEISQWISGRRTPDRGRVRDLAKLLKCKMTDLYSNINQLREERINGN